MKCANCGAKIKVGCVYCSVCGKEAQIVPDYNLEEDYLNSLLVEKEKEKKSSQRKPSQKKSPAKKNAKEKPSKKGLYVKIAVFVIAVIGIFVTGFIYMTSHSYEGRLEKAETAYGKEDYSKAIAYAKQALEKNDKDAKAYVLLGKSYLAKEEKEQAEKYLKQVVELKKSSKEAYELLIEHYATEKDYASIEKLYAGVENEEWKELFDEYILEVPEIEPEGGEYGEYPDIILRTDEDADIYYTTDGSSPKKNGVLYEEPFSIKEEGSTTIRAVCKDERGIYSPELKQEYNIKLDVPELPTASPVSGTYQQPEPITIYVPENCNAYYTWNGTPDVNSTLYTGPFEMIQGNNVLSIILVNKNGQTSGIQKYNYIYMP